MTATEVALLKQELEQANRKLDAILRQAQETNGRVKELEKFRERVMGALIPLTVLSPIATGLIVGFILTG
jgi:hypothetical protein